MIKDKKFAEGYTKNWQGEKGDSIENSYLVDAWVSFLARPWRRLTPKFRHSLAHGERNIQQGGVFENGKRGES